MLTPHIFRLTNKQGMQIEVMDWGATWLSCKIPVEGQLREVLLGCQPQHYDQQSAYLGATIGRYANRIANSSYNWQGKKIILSANQGNHQLHGGQGFDQRYWQLQKCGKNFIIFSLFSAAGDQGFLGNVETTVSYHLTEQNEVEIEFKAQSDQDTPLNLTNHAYFNLIDAQQPLQDVRQHLLQVVADYYLPVDAEGIPNRNLTKVEQTSFDFRQLKSIAQDFLQGDQQMTKGYDHAFLLNVEDRQQQAVATLVAPDKLLTLELYTSQPALQVYTGNYLAGTPTRNQQYYQNYAGIALETQALPDTPNHPEWHKFGGMVRAGQHYTQWTKFSFTTL